MFARLIAIVRATHFLPTVTVTTVAALLARTADHPTPWLIAGAVVLGQASVGWSNDAIDARRDALNQRGSKPTVQGRVSPRLLGVLALIALVLTVPVSLLAAGQGRGLLHVLAVLSAWLYNVGVKATWFSFVPYAFSFALLPLVVGSPQLWVVVVFALFGVGAHLANGIADIEHDVRSDTRGIVARLGARASTLLALVLLLTATWVITVAAESAWPWALPAAALVVVVVLRRRLFHASLVLAMLNALWIVLHSASVFA